MAAKPMRRRGLPGPRALALLMLCGALPWSGCALKLIRPQVLTVREAPDRPAETLKYPFRVLVHDDESFWDAHQLKGNLLGLMELEVIRVADLAVDLLIPGPEVRPIESSVVWLRGQSLRLPQWAPTRIISQLLWAIGAEKTCPARSNASFLRVLYLVDWVRFTLGEFNRLGGYLIPGQPTLIPRRWTCYPDRGFSWTLNRICGGYIFVIQAADWVLDKVLDGEEAAYGGTVWLCAAPFMKSTQSAIPAETARANGGGASSPATERPSVEGAQ